MSGLSRVCSFALVALHLVAALGAPLADDPGGAAHGRPHLASEQGDDCAPPHDHFLCQLCRTTRSQATPPAAAVAPPVGSARLSSAPRALADAPPAAPTFQLHRSRAPPLT